MHIGYYKKRCEISTCGTLSTGFLNCLKKTQFLSFFLKIAQNFISVYYKPILNVFDHNWTQTYKFEVQRKRQKSLVIHRLIILPQARPPINEVKVQIRSIRD